jgi:hypothetical protein
VYLITMVFSGVKLVILEFLGLSWLFLEFHVILVILEFSELFWSFWSFKVILVVMVFSRLYWSYWSFRDYFGHFKSSVLF